MTTLESILIGVLVVAFFEPVIGICLWWAERSRQAECLLSPHLAPLCDITAGPDAGAGTTST